MLLRPPRVLNSSRKTRALNLKAKKEQQQQQRQKKKKKTLRRWMDGAATHQLSVVR
jgi:hypothetical protein